MQGDDLQERLARVNLGIAQAAERSGRPGSAVRLVAVSKTIPADVVRQAVMAGVTDLGENRVQEAQQKIPALRDLTVRWHLIGHLQSNKVSKALPLFDVVQSVDTVELATLLSRRAATRSEPLDILYEVNVGAEASKTGFTPEQLEAAAPTLAALPGLRSLGLMTVAPDVTDPQDARPFFRQLRLLRERLVGNFGASFQDLSMGMSHDFPVAVGEGATIVRVGTAIFGQRSPRQL